MGYLGNAPARNTPAYKQVYEFVATAGQTTFAVSYTPGFVEVYRNGVKLGAPNFTASNGTSVVLTSGANAGDFIQIISEFINPVLNAIPNTTGAVATNNIADNAITTAKIAAGAVVQADIATGVAGTGPAFSAYPSATSSPIASGTFVKVTLDAEEFDTNNNFASSRFTPTVAGYYQINGAVSPSAYAGNYLLCGIYKNGSLYKSGSNFTLNAAAGPTTTVSSLVYFNGSTDYVELYVIAQGTPQIFGANTYATFFNGSLVRAA